MLGLNWLTESGHNIQRNINYIRALLVFLVQLPQCQLLCSLMMCENKLIHFGLTVVYGYLHVLLPHCDHCADLSESIDLLKCSLEFVSTIRSVLSTIFHEIYGAVCIQLTHFSYYDWENTCTWSYHHHHQIWRPICHCLWICHAIMVGAVCLSIFFWINRELYGSMNNISPTSNL